MLKRVFFISSMDAYIIFCSSRIEGLLFFVMLMLQHQGAGLHGCSLMLYSLLAACLCRGCFAQELWTVDVDTEKVAFNSSVPVVLLLTETGVAHDGTSEGATPAPASEHEEDNSLGYTGTAADI